MWQVGHEDVCLGMLEAKVDANFQDESGARGLHKAAAGGHDGVCSLLLERGAERDAKDGEGKTAFERAVGAAVRRVFIERCA